MSEILFICHSPELRSGFRNLNFIGFIDPEILVSAEVGYDIGEQFRMTKNAILQKSIKIN